jgi:hypothetical protein
MATCEICHRGPFDGVTLWRANETGVAGIWRCTEHRQGPVDPVLEEIVSDIEDAIHEGEEEPYA